jgi:demethylmenaquinone methyltransferase/2-methoxy-6-polyprenyl-1,4-benzoquinol methylase
MTSSKGAVKANYNRMRRWYDIIAGSEKKFRDAGLRKLNVSCGEKILEIGFGTGLGLVTLAQAAGDTGKIYGIDLSDGMYEVTHTRIKKAGLLDKIEIICQDAIPLPYESYFFDAVFMCFVLELFEASEVPLILNECHRVLRRQGRIGVVGLSEKPGVAVKIYKWMHEKFPSVVDCHPISVGKIVEESHFLVTDSTLMSLWSLPVEIVIASKV